MWNERLKCVFGHKIWNHDLNFLIFETEMCNVWIFCECSYLVSFGFWLVCLFWFWFWYDKIKIVFPESFAVSFKKISKAQQQCKIYLDILWLMQSDA